MHTLHAMYALQNLADQVEAQDHTIILAHLPLCDPLGQNFKASVILWFQCPMARWVNMSHGY